MVQEHEFRRASPVHRRIIGSTCEAGARSTASPARGPVVSAEADSSVLSLKTLAESGEYTALAALVHHADMEDALGALAASARDQKALSWVVALLALKLPPEGYEPHAQTKQEAYVQQLNDNLPEDLRVPEELREEVEEFVLTVPTLAQQPWPRGRRRPASFGTWTGRRLSWPWRSVTRTSRTRRSPCWAARASPGGAPSSSSAQMTCRSRRDYRR